MVIVNVILAHRDSIRFFNQQVTLIRKYCKVNKGSNMKIYGYVDSKNKKIKKSCS